MKSTAGGAGNVVLGAWRNTKRCGSRAPPERVPHLLWSRPRRPPAMPEPLSTPNNAQVGQKVGGIFGEVSERLARGRGYFVKVTSWGFAMTMTVSEGELALPSESTTSLRLAG